MSKKRKKKVKMVSAGKRERLTKCSNCGALRVYNGVCTACGIPVTTDVTAETGKG